MFRFLAPFLLCLPLFTFAFHWFYSPAAYSNQPMLLSATDKAPKMKSAKADPLKLKREDLIEGQDKGWYPEVGAEPEDFLEEMELPERTEAPEETKTT